MKPAPILIIDKIGLIGESLALKLSNKFSIILVTKESGDSFAQNKNIIYILFRRRFPLIPDNKYSHIVVIDQDGADLKFLSKIIEKAKDVNADFILALGLSSKGEYYTRKALSLFSAAKTVFYGEIFDTNKFIYQAQKFGRIQIPGDGLTRVYPVFVQDIADGLSEVVLGHYNSHSVFYIFPKHSLSELSLAHMIQKANPEVVIDFVKPINKKEDISYPPHGKYLLDDKYPLAEKIRKMDIGNAIIPLENKTSEEKCGRLKHFLFFIFWISVFLIFAPLIFTLVFSFLGINSLYTAKAQIDKGSLNNAKSSIHLAQTFFSLGEKTSNILLFQGKLIGYQDNIRRFSADINLGHKLSLSLLQIFDAGWYFAKVLDGTSKNPKDDFAKAQNNLRNAIIAFDNIRAEGKVSEVFTEKIKAIDSLIKLAFSTSDVMPSILGLEGQKIYLVLFQNNMELRPGGGFIGSYGILRLNMGRIDDFSIHDVYDADGQLRGHVEPPFAIRRHLPSAHWYMRDSNFDADFIKSASSSSNFLNIETGQKVSGVISADVSFVKNILRATGPVYVPDYKEKVDENNLYILTQSHSEKNFFPGSTQKKDFLRSLYKAIQVKIIEGNISYFSLIQAISDSITQKHLLFAFNDNFQNIFTVNGWSSSLWDERKNNAESINDFLGINEANLGVNKVNYFIARNISQKVSIDRTGKVSSELSISYKNSSDGWPGGEYKNYLRVILPLNTKISEISINDNPQLIIHAITDPLIYEAKNFKAPNGLEVEKVNEESKTIYGFIVKVPVGEIVKVKIKYDLEKKVNPDLNTFSYNLRLFKQPGIDSIPYSFSLHHPDNFNVINGKSSFSERIIKDKDLIINFARK